MLSAFTARPLVELKQRDKSKIEAVLSYGDRLLVGLNTGSLRIYRINDLGDDSQSLDSNGRPVSSPNSINLLREQEKFSKYRIEQLARIKEANILLSLSNGLVSIYDLASYELQETLAQAKGASAFALTSNIVKDEAIGINEIVSRVAVAVKRKLMLWSWRDSVLSDEVQEITLNTAIRTVTWITGTRLIVGLASSYVLVNGTTSSVTDIYGPGSIGGGMTQDTGRFGGMGVGNLVGSYSPSPLVTRLGEGEVLLAKDVNTHFINYDGDSLNRRQIPWHVGPDAVGYSYPYLLTLQTAKGTLEVRNPETLTNLQTISLSGARLLHVPNPGVSLAHAGKGFLVCSERCIWRMDALSYDAQIDALCEHRRFTEAEKLLGMLEDALLTDKEGRLREVRMLEAEDLFAHKRFSEAFNYFIQARAPPQRVIHLYPPAISGNEHAELEEAAVEDPFFKDESGIEVAEAKQPDTASIMSSTVAHVTGRGNHVGTTHQAGALDGKELKNASIELASFLVDTRTRIQRIMAFDGNFKPVDDNSSIKAENEAVMKELVGISGESEDSLEKLREVAKLVDTTLFRAHMLARPSLAGSLFRLPNFCDAEVVEEKLLEQKRFNELIDFLYGKKLHRKALELLRQFGERIREDTPETLQGPQRTITYLQNLAPDMIGITLEYINWPLEADPTTAMQVFVADTENAETLPKRQVLDFLQERDTKLSATYLEHIIQELGEKDSDLHQKLIELYIQNVSSAEGAQKALLQSKLLQFLRSSKHYEAWRVLPLLTKENSDLFEARAIVLGRIGEHRQALNIYVYDLQDADKAEEYCNQVYLDVLQKGTISPQSVLSEDDEKPSIYQILLSLYLTPTHPRQPQWDPALELLAKHGSRLPAAATLGVIPETLAVQKLEPYFRGRMRAGNLVYNQARIVAGLRKSLDVEEEAALRLGDGVPRGNMGRNRSVVITEERVCGVCHKRFGGSAIKILPNNSVVHYGCSVR